MAFNKKRACCCGSSETDVAYFEVKSVVPIAAAEQVIAKTYSYWFRRENTTFVSGNVPDSTVLWERGSGTNVNSELSADLTYGAWKSAGSNTAYVPGSGGDAKVGSSNTPVQSGGPSITPGGAPVQAMDLALHRRGWYLDSSTRVLTEAQWDALDECKVELPLPVVASTGSGGNNAIEIYRKRGWMFGGGQFNANPAIGPITKGDLTWEVYPKVNCNYPIKGDVHDFTALFPSTLSVDLQGTVSIAYKYIGGGNLLYFTSASCSGSYTFTKTDSNGGISYVQTSPTPGTGSIGQVDVGPFSDFAGGTYTRTLKVEQPNYEIQINNFSRFVPIPLQGSNLFQTGTSSSCTNQIGYNIDANRFTCADCDPNSIVKAYFSGCSPANFDGSFLKTRNYVSFGSAAPARDPNTLGVDLGLATNYPTDEAFMTHFQGGMLNGIWTQPVLTWGEATGSEVNLQIKTPPGPGLDSFIRRAPEFTCCQPDEGSSPIQYWMAGGSYIGFGDGETVVELSSTEAGPLIQTT